MNDFEFKSAITGLLCGDFTKSESFFDSPADSPGALPPIIEWHKQGLFHSEPDALAEAFSCACFLGKTGVVEYLIEQGSGPSGGMATGMNALHWAADRGQLETVRLLLGHNPQFEVRNMYGGTVLGFAVWSALQLLRPHHLEIIQLLVDAGADVGEIELPTGNVQIDAILVQNR